MTSLKRCPEDVLVAAESKKQKVTRAQRLPHGLYNQGATCYLNSVLQVLFMTTEIHDRLDPESRITDQELRNLFERLEETTCETENVTKSLELENVHEQGDAAECLELILQKVSPQASEVFEGQLTYITKCREGHGINEEMNPFRILPLSLDDTSDTTFSVEKGFEMIFQTKSFSGDNMVFCNECNGKTEATCGCEMVQYPPILTLLLKRFDLDYNTMSHVKSDRCVDVPLTLQTKEKKYTLYGMVNHMGGLRSGHYTATLLSSEDRTWYEFDDTHVRKVEEQPFTKARTYKSISAYLLLYRASGSLKDKMKQHQDESGHLDEQIGSKEEHEKRFGESDADDEQSGQNRERAAQMRRERNKEALSHQDEHFLLQQKQHRSPESWTKAEKRRQRIKKKGDASPQPSKTSPDINNNPLLICVIVFGCLLTVTLLLILISLSHVW